MDKIRLDDLLVSLGLAENKSQAQALIMAGYVWSGDKRLEKAGSQVAADTELGIRGGLKYVGRGGLKMEAAAGEFGIDFTGKVIADIGASTGGFTDFALQNGANKVFAIDVGKNQLAEKLRQDSRVIVMDEVNARNLESLPEQIDIFMIDVSFISAQLILEAVRRIAKDYTAQIVLLFKPQFEVGPKNLKKGIVKSAEITNEAIDDFKNWLAGHNFEMIKSTPSPIKGAKGNQEYFFLISKSVTSNS